VAGGSPLGRLSPEYSTDLKQLSNQYLDPLARLNMPTEPNLDDLFDELCKPLKGSAESQEALVEAVQQRFPGKGFCLVQAWRVLRADLNERELAKVADAGHLPLFMQSNRVIVDSRGRFLPGDSVRSSMAVSFSDGVMFETKNTVYVLMGDGHEMLADLKSIFSFF